VIIFLGTNRKLENCDFIRAEYDKTEHLENATIVFLSDSYKSNLTEDQLRSISDKLVYITDEKKTSIIPFRKMNHSDFNNLSDDMLLDLMTLLEYKETNYALENDIAIQEVLHDELLYKQEEFQATKEIALHLSADGSFEERVKKVSETILEFFKVPSGIFLLKQDLYFNQIFHSYNATCSPFITAKGSLINWVERNQMPLFVKDLVNDMRFQVTHEINYPNLPVYAQPIIGDHGHFIGIFFLFCKDQERAFSADDIEKINTFFEVISPLIVNAILKKELEHMYKVKSHFLANMNYWICRYSHDGRVE
jgi:GAF domain-containing protein